MPVATWLLSQQNENGGFASTSDTYVAVDALERFSRKLRIPNRGTDISVQYSYLKGPSINDVTHKWGRGVVQNVTIVLMGCLYLTVTRGKGSKNVNNHNVCDVIYE